jgi:hypothetical protein
MVALVLIFGVLLGLLHTVVTASKGIVTSRQRNVAVGLANQVIEEARATSYALVGLNTSTGDPSIGTDTAIVSGQYDGKPLAFASPAASSPWSPHETSQVINNTTYITKVYVTTITPATGSGEAYKRVTAVIDWTGATSQYGTGSAIKSQVKLESYIYNAQLPADPLLRGLATASGGFFSISGEVDHFDFDATFALPRTNSDLSSQLIRSATGLAQSSSADITGDLGLTASGTGVASGLSGNVPSVKVSSSADNDAGTNFPLDSEASSSDAGGSIGRANTVTMIKGASSSLYSKSTAKSTSLTNGDNDNLPHTVSDATGPASFTMPFALGEVLGTTSVGDLLTTGATHANTVIDRDDSGSNKTIRSQSTVAHPATTVLSLVSSGLTILAASGLPFSGLVKVGATGDVVATANAGAGAANPSITGGSFEVCLFDTVSPPLFPQGTCPLGYERLVVVPGTAGSLSTSASLLLNGQGLSLTASVTSGTKSVPSPTISGADIERAEAALLNWLRVNVTLSIGGDTSLTLELNYGSLEARSKYCLPDDVACIKADL